MNGVRYLLDTNIVIGMYRRDKTVLAICAEQKIRLSECAFSAITRMELLSYHGITGEEELAINALLGRMIHLSITPDVEDLTIRVRRQHRLKLPDAIIAATAKAHGITLLTLDKELAAKV